MKKVFLASILFASACPSWAVVTTTLKVAGTLTNSACVPNLSNGGVVDFGTIRLGELSPTANNALGERTITFSISCDSPTKVGWTSLDNRSATDPNLPVHFVDSNYTMTATSQVFGLGQTAAGVGIGSYAIEVPASGVTADGVLATIMYRQKDQSPQTPWTTTPFMHGQDSNFRTASVGGDDKMPIAFTTAVFPMIVSATIKSTNALAITDDTQLDGQMTISLVYL
ncbi:MULTISPECIES: DUF1120 domain-containing protein [Buttiauxella]|jgi:hypothetical protein|uniref:Beta-fimbriae putative major subunit n=1 Tax=Buttiauxella brennerae ATCC 51605 TaxID=1354251 RepID=A0A1B7IRJ5_9ENTR|nr:DUF1120 domain-containing protein [Buttiauxella brennerae]OAT32382.1 beta-fimbriae putative major subunit [Buttiauxella brennerae ATCC 51605]